MDYTENDLRTAILNLLQSYDVAGNSLRAWPLPTPGHFEVAVDHASGVEIARFKLHIFQQ